MAPLEIRLFGDPVLKQKAAEVTDVTDALVRLADDMLVTMYEAPGLGLAATQIGVQKRLFVYDIGDGPNTIVNPVVSDARGEWVYDEGCLSIPGLYFELVRPKEIHLTGYDLDGNEVSIEADELLARLFQHELDHLDGKLMLEMLDAEQRREALRELRRRAIEPVEPGTPKKRISLS
ncbi:MAG: peptide deformylase [Acidimicrobiales bacterium]